MNGEKVYDRAGQTTRARWARLKIRDCHENSYCEGGGEGGEEIRSTSSAEGLKKAETSLAVGIWKKMERG